MKKTADLRKMKEEYPFTPHYMYAGKYRMHYVDEGTGPAIIMLHACPMWSFFFRNLIKEFSQKFREIAPDAIGYGLSDKPDGYDYRLETQIDNLERLVEHLNLEKFSLVMHGWGATIGTGFTVRHSERVDRIVVMNSIDFSGYRLPFRFQLCKWFPVIGKPLLMNTNMIFWGLGAHPDSVRNGYMYPYRKHKTRIALYRFIDDIPCKPDDPSFESVIEVEHGLWILREHKMCIVWGVRDWLYPERYLHRWMNYCPDAKVHRIPFGGRYLTEDAPEELAAIVSGFLETPDK